MAISVTHRSGITLQLQLEIGVPARLGDTALPEPRREMEPHLRRLYWSQRHELNVKLLREAPVQVVGADLTAAKWRIDRVRDGDGQPRPLLSEYRAPVGMIALDPDVSPGRHGTAKKFHRGSGNTASNICWVYGPTPSRSKILMFKSTTRKPYTSTGPKP